MEQLANFQYKIIHRPGKQYANADALSRLPGSGRGGIREGGDNFPQSKVQVTVVRAVSEAEIMGGPRRHIQESEDDLVRLSERTQIFSC